MKVLLLYNVLQELKKAHNYGFDTSKRLTNSRQFSKVLRQGQTQRNPLFVIVSLPNDQATGRLGVTVSKKVSKKAVQRNRIKRLIRETFRHHHSQLKNHDFVIIARGHAAKADNQTITETLAKMWATKTSKKICN